MKKNEILTELFESKTIKETFRRVKQSSDTRENLQDLEQDIYLYLMEDDKVERLYKENKLHFYVVRLILNQLRSQTSRYFYLYKRWDSKRSGFKNNDDEETRELLCD